MCDMRVVGYQVADSNTLAGLLEAVRVIMTIRGWVPLGSLCVVAEAGGRHYYQALVEVEHGDEEVLQ